MTLNGEVMLTGWSASPLHYSVTLLHGSAGARLFGFSSVERVLLLNRALKSRTPDALGPWTLDFGLRTSDFGLRTYFFPALVRACSSKPFARLARSAFVVVAETIFSSG